MFKKAGRPVKKVSPNASWVTTGSSSMEQPTQVYQSPTKKEDDQDEISSTSSSSQDDENTSNESTTSDDETSDTGSTNSGGSSESSDEEEEEREDRRKAERRREPDSAVDQNGRASKKGTLFTLSFCLLLAQPNPLLPPQTIYSNGSSKRRRK